MQTEASALVVSTEFGKVEGEMADSTIRVFRGIPYAAPPVGNLRWRPPQPPEAWSGVRPAIEFSADCPQVLEVGTRATSQSEDCLYLNIWSPVNAEKEQLPVMVWIHGGSYVSGSGSEIRSDGTALAQQGVVVVSINYRLGMFGFLSHPELTAESEHGFSGNYGLLDQILALKWVRANIANFGGDPKNITAFGVSAGSASLGLLMASSQGGGLFDRAILQSPGAARPLASLADAEAAGATLGLSLDALRQLSGAEVLGKTGLLAPKVRGLTFPRVLRPIRDGWLLPEDERPVFKSGRLHKVPMIIGTNADEGTDFTAEWPITNQQQYRALVEQNFPSMVEAALDMYKADTDAEVVPQVAQMFADTQFNYGTRLLAQSMAATGTPTWRYVFTHRRLNQHTGPYHLDEIPFVFGSFDNARPDTACEFNAADKVLGVEVMKAWIAFAREGSPNHAGLPEWPQYEVGADRHLDIGDEVKVGSNWRRVKLDFIDKYYDSI